MTKNLSWSKILAVGALASACGAAWAQTSVQYGRITAVNAITEASGRAQTAGAILGGGYAALAVWSAKRCWHWAGAKWFPLWWQRMPSLLAANRSAEHCSAAAGARPEAEQCPALRPGSASPPT